MDEEVVQDGMNWIRITFKKHISIWSKKIRFLVFVSDWILISVPCFFPGVRVLIDQKAQLTLLGTEMDYQENKLSAEFVFNNPNIKGTCGCGESFSV